MLWPFSEYFNIYPLLILELNKLSQSGLSRSYCSCSTCGFNDLVYSERCLSGGPLYPRFKFKWHCWIMMQYFQHALVSHTRTQRRLGKFWVTQHNWSGFSPGERINLSSFVLPDALSNRIWSGPTSIERIPLSV